MTHTRPPPPPGFTLLEMVVALALFGIVASAVWSLQSSLTAARDRSWRQGDIEQTAAEIERGLRGAINDAAAVPPAPNLAAVSALAGGTSDTLVVLKATDLAATVASRGCSGCLAIQGDGTAAWTSGDALIAGTPTGARVLQINAPPRRLGAACGAACAERLVCPVTNTNPVSNVWRVVAGTRAGVSSTSCEQPYFPDGTSCSERRTAVPAQPLPVPACVVTGKSQIITELPNTDRTATLGFPAGIWSRQSGGGGTPTATATRVQPERWWIENPGTPNGRLMRERLATNGSWEQPEPIAAPVSQLRVESLDADGVWRRGTPVTAAMLAHDAANANYQQLTTPTAAGGQPWSFRRSYATIAALRLTATIPDAFADGTIVPRTLSITMPIRRTQQ